MNDLNQSKHLRLTLVLTALFFDSLPLQQRSGETVKVHQLDVAIPLQLKSQLKKGGGGQPCISEGDSDISDTMQFVMLTRKGNKQQVSVHGRRLTDTTRLLHRRID